MKNDENGVTRDELLDNLSCGLTVYKVSARGEISIEYLNDEFFRICEYERGVLTPLMNDDPLFGIHDGDRAACSDTLDGIIRDRRGAELTYRYITGKGRIIWVNANFRVHSSDDGSMTLYCTCFDVSDEIETQRRLSDIIHTLPCGICVYSWDGKSCVRCWQTLILTRFSAATR